MWLDINKRNSVITEIMASFLRLKTYCESQSFVGHDVGDGIESPIITHTLLGKSRLLRFILQQTTAHRAAFVNVRPFLAVPKLCNAKGIALFLNGYCNLYELLEAGVEVKDYSKDDCLNRIYELADLLVSLRSKGKHYYGWGYPIAWQGRMHFYFPPHTPTIVASSFAADALFHAFDITRQSHYRKVALETADFILNDLHRTPHKGGFLFSYSSYSGNDTVYNASLLGGRTLAQCYKYSGNQEYLKIAKECMDTCIKEQRNDGSWTYGMEHYQTWIDNFHTGYNLEAIREYQLISGDTEYEAVLRKGAKFMIENHFDGQHIPKYYHNKQYPIDIHCCGEIFVVLHKLGIFSENESLADDVYRWTIRNMFNEKEGYFYFQKRSWITNKTPLMRWSEAFMFNALSFYMKSKFNIQ